MILPPLKTITVLVTLLMCQLVSAQKLIIRSNINDGWSITKSNSSGCDINSNYPISYLDSILSKKSECNEYGPNVFGDVTVKK